MGDVDIALRQVSRRFPEEVVRALSAPGVKVGGVRWLDTQVTTRERRLDRALLAMVQGRPTVFLVEWAWHWTRIRASAPNPREK